MPSLSKERTRLPVLSRYEFQKPIGAGGVGTVYRAVDRRNGDLVAIKVLRFRPSESPVLHQRIIREFRAATELEHPNIVRAHSCETIDDVTYLVYELVEGGSLIERLENQRRFPEADAVRIITQVAQALQYAHDRGVVHRDIKPDNILLLPDGRAKLTDFGLAKTIDSDEDGLTRPETGLGTPQYMAPEQFSDAKGVDARSDIYSLGATLYTLVTGKLPFDGKTALAIMTQKEMLKYPPARSVVPGLSERVEAAIASAIRPNPAGRPQSCLAFFKMLTGRRQGKDPAATGTHWTAQNRRASVRYSLYVGGLSGIDPGIQVGADLEMWPVVIRDLSAGGLGMLLARRFEPGTELVIMVGDGLTEPARRLATRVVRVQAERTGHWVHGCVFDSPLNEQALTALFKRMMC